MIPIDNTVAGRVADIHHLMPASDLFITGEHFLRVRHQLLVLPGTKPEELKRVTSHTHALGQCRRLTAEMGLEAVAAVDTAGAAAALAQSGRPLNCRDCLKKSCRDLRPGGHAG